MRWFICYSINNNFCNEIIEEYPIDWVFDENDNERKDHAMIPSNYVLHWFTKIDEDLCKSYHE